METIVEKIDGSSADVKKILRAAEIVDAGGLVAFPTETVYGIAVAATDKAIKKLDETKQRPGDKRYTLHIDHPAMSEKYVPHMPLRAKKLIKNAWPGPLTVVFELADDQLTQLKSYLPADTFDLLYQGGTIGVRCPDNDIARKLLFACQSPVVAPSANVSGMDPAINAQGVLNTLDGKIDMVLDGGQCQHSQPSTVVKFNGSQMQILRPGAMPEDVLQEMSSVKVLFVCTGNTCRSPMAEGICKKYIAEKFKCNVDKIETFGYKVCSAGVAAYEGGPASSQGVEVCREKGIDLDSHLSTMLDSDLVNSADYIFVMSNGHLNSVVGMWPDAEKKSFMLDSRSQISDPIGQDVAAYRRCAAQIEKAVKEWMDNIL